MNPSTTMPRLVWTNVYGLGRSLLAFGTLLTVLLNDHLTLFRPVAESLRQVQITPLQQLNLFVLLDGQPWLARSFAVIVLLAVVIGWRPRFTGVLHAWVVSSLASGTLVLDGGDQIAAVLAVLLIPVTLTDGRRWHWSTPEQPADSRTWAARIAVADATRAMVRLQVAFIYFQSTVEKFAKTEWRNGTATYYWFTNSTIGMPDWLMPAASLLTNGPVVVAVTWGTLLLETVLFMSLVMAPSIRKRLLGPAVGFHFTIVLVFGLFTFFFSMAGAAMLLLWPWEQPLRLQESWRGFGVRARRLIGRTGSREAIIEGHVVRA